MAKHDEFFSRSIEHFQFAKEFIQIHLPDHLKPLIDAENITRIDRTNTDRDLNKHHRDIIYRVPLKNKADGSLIVAIEHQSSKDKMIPIRFLRYTADNLEAWINEGNEQWPTLVNLLLYHGEKSPYPYPCSSDKLYQNPLLGKQELWIHFYVRDLGEVSDEEIITHGLCAPMEVLFKHSRDGEPALAAKDYRDAFLACVAKLGNDYLYSILSYIDSIENEIVGEKLHKFVEEVYENKQDIIMTYGQVRTQEARQEGIEIGLLKGVIEGIQQGMQKGKEEGIKARNVEIARNLLKRGFELTSIQEVTGLTLDELKTLE